MRASLREARGFTSAPQGGRFYTLYFTRGWSHLCAPGRAASYFILYTGKERFRGLVPMIMAYLECIKTDTHTLDTV